MIKLIMILLGLTCTSLHEEAVQQKDTSLSCSAKSGAYTDDLINVSIFQPIIN